MGSEPGADERQLRWRLLAREGRAMAELYDEFSPTVFGVALQVTENTQAAEDVTRSVFVDLWRHPEWWDPELGEFRPWLATVARHRSLRWVRGGRVSEPGADVDLRTPPSEERPPTTPGAPLTPESVRRALARLPDNERTPILLAYFGGRSYRDIASDLGVDEAVVKRQIRDGLWRMDAALRGEPAPEPPSMEDVVPE